MRAVVGILATLLLLFGAVVGVLAIWGIYPLSFDLIWRSGLTVLIVGVAFLMIYLLYHLFFKKRKYNKGQGKAHPIE